MFGHEHWSRATVVTCVLAAAVLLVACGAQGEVSATAPQTTVPVSSIASVDDKTDRSLPPPTDERVTVGGVTYVVESLEWYEVVEIGDSTERGTDIPTTPPWLTSGKGVDPALVPDLVPWCNAPACDVVAGFSSGAMFRASGVPNENPCLDLPYIELVDRDYSVVGWMGPDGFLDAADAKAPPMDQVCHTQRPG
jgi:hypothetical protein